MKIFNINNVQSRTQIRARQNQVTGVQTEQKLETFTHELNLRKQKRIIETSKFFLAKHRQYNNSKIRFVLSDENEKLTVSKGTLNIGTGEINVEEGSNGVVLNVQPKVLLSAEPSTFYV